MTGNGPPPQPVCQTTAVGHNQTQLTLRRNASHPLVGRNQPAPFKSDSRDYEHTTAQGGGPHPALSLGTQPEVLPNLPVGPSLAAGVMTAMDRCQREVHSLSLRPSVPCMIVHDRLVAVAWLFGVLLALSWRVSWDNIVHGLQFADGGSGSGTVDA